MQIFALGFTDEQLNFLKKLYCREELIVIKDWQDVIALCSDVVLMNVDNINRDAINTILEYKEEVGNEDPSIYIELTNDDFPEHSSWKKQYLSIAVDFDGTLSFGKWPECGPPNTPLFEFLKFRKKLGDKIILWSCREGKNLDEAVSWCSDQGLIFDAINDNLPEKIREYGCNSRKISCDYYIDDKMFPINAYQLVR